MAKIGLVILFVFNIYGLYMAGILNTAGTGSVNSASITWGVGGLWVLAFTYAAWKMCERGQNALGLLIAFLTWPAGNLVGIAIHLGKSTIGNFVSDHKSLAPEFELACKSAGAKYLARPNTPVRSIAYDWEGSGPPQLNTFRLAATGRIESGTFQKARLPASIEFIEARCCANRGRPLTGEGPYIREPNVNNLDYFGVKELTADALVKYETSKASTPTAQSELAQVKLTVSDRRDGQTLATFTYIHDTKNKKLCGATSEGIMDEPAFVRKAVGVD